MYPQPPCLGFSWNSQMSKHVYIYCKLKYVAIYLKLLTTFMILRSFETLLFYIVFQVLNVLIKICKLQPPNLVFLFVFISFYVNRYHFSKIFRTSFKNIWKRYFCIFVTKFPFLTDLFTPPPLPDPLNSHHLVSTTKQEVCNEHSISQRWHLGCQNFEF